MSDKLKKFIQQSKSQFDSETPRPDLFEKIMEKVTQGPKTQITPKRLFQFGLRWMALAASITLLIVCALFFYLSDNQIQNKNSQIADKPIEQIEKITILPEPVVQDVPLINNQKHLDKINPAEHAINPSVAHKIKRSRSNNIQNKEKVNILAEISDTLKDLVVIEKTKPEIISPESSTNAITTDDTQTIQKETIVQNDSAKEAIQLQPLIVAAPTTEAETKLSPTKETIEEQKSSTLANVSVTELLTNEEEEENSSLKSTISKSFFSFLFRKAKKWGGNTVTIKNEENNKTPILAVHIKNDLFEFSKEIKLGNFEK